MSTTAVHAIHVTPKAIASFAETRAVRPQTERNLGDGVVPADKYLKHGVSIRSNVQSRAIDSKTHANWNTTCVCRSWNARCSIKRLRSQV